MTKVNNVQFQLDRCGMQLGGGGKFAQKKVVVAQERGNNRKVGKP